MPVASDATNLFFNRDTKIFAVQQKANGASTYNVWELPVLAGYSFSQTTNSSQVTLNEMSDATGRSRRGQQAFNDSLSPAEWSFDTYTRPSLVTTAPLCRAPEELLWHSLLSETLLDPAAGAAGVAVQSWSFLTTTVTLTVTAHPFKVGDQITTSGLAASNTPTNIPNGVYTITGITNTTIIFTAPLAPSGTPTPTTGFIKSTTFSSTATSLEFLPTNSNKTRLATFDLYFVLGANKVSGSGNYLADGDTTIYKIADCCVNEATMNFEIDGISMISWSGMGSKISEVTDAINFTTGSYTLQTALANTPMKVVTTDTMLTSTSNMIRNRLTSLNIEGTNPGINSGATKTYAITLTGGSITISNNINFLTPEVLGVVNTPLGHVTSTRSVSGSFTAYLDEQVNGAMDLYSDLLKATTLVTNKFKLQFFVGGKADASNAVAPGVLIDMGQCHLEIPAINIDDVIGVEMNFTALPTTISGTDELTKIRYAGV